VTPKNLGNHERALKFELDWFAFQTQTRKMIIELTEPTVNRAKLNEVTMGEIKEENARLRDKIEELGFVMQKVQKHSVAVDGGNSKVNEIVSARRLMG